MPRIFSTFNGDLEEHNPDTVGVWTFDSSMMSLCAAVLRAEAEEASR